MSRDPVILLLAGEPSGDLHAAGVARALRERWPGARLVGIGGERMAREGVELLAGLEDLAVMGFVEVAARLSFFRRLEERIRALLDRGEVDLALPVDYPGFNLRVAGEARRRGIPVLYYIAPQVWAWRAGRARRLARDADRIAVVLPFEEEVFRAAGDRVTFVGHPLLDEPHTPADRRTFAEGLGLRPDRPFLAVFPGSRPQEVERHLELFAATARRVVEARPDVQPVVARAGALPEESFRAAGFPVTEDGRTLLHHATAALVKSGTTTLEAALEATPFVTVYRTHPLTFAIARRLVRVPHVALANLVAGDRIVPELLQGEATVEGILSHLLPLLDEDDPRRVEMVVGLARIRLALGEPGAARRVAALAAELLEGG